jgi:hypothetical protein
MPYVRCTACGLAAFTAAYRFQPDSCERCGTELPRPRGHEPIGPHTRAEVENAVRQRLYPRGSSGAVERPAH